ncbi:MAG: UPF0182 family protein [Candidatus Ranarchaeia archaeon]
MQLRRMHIFILSIIVLMALAAMTLFGLNWLLLIKIYETAFQAKMGISWWRVKTLDNQLFSAAILLTICSMITLPTKSTLYTLYTNFSRLVGFKPLGKRIVILWRTLQIVFLFGSYLLGGGYSLSGTNVAFLLFLANNGTINISPQNFNIFFIFVLNPYTDSSTVIGSVPLMESFNFYSALISTFLIFTVIRLGFLIISDLFPPRPNMIFIKASLIGAIISVSGLLSINTWVVNVGTWVSVAQIVMQTTMFLVFSFFLFLYHQKFTGAKTRKRDINRLQKELGRVDKEIRALRANPDHVVGGISPELDHLYRKRREIAVEYYRLKNRGITVVPVPLRPMGLLAIPLIIILIGAPIYHYFVYQIQMEGARYVDWKFSTEIKKQIDVTRWATGIDQYQRLNLADFIANTTSSGIEDLMHIRQWDQTASRTKMQNQIGVNWMQLADSDIIYIAGQEYWMAPLTLNPQQTSVDWLSKSIRYTHSEGFIAINSFTGVVLNDAEFLSTFNVSSNVPIYYGDDFSDHEVYVDVPGYQEIGSNSFNGTPDYVLQGLESSLWMFTKGQWSFMGKTLGMLIERDARQRVNTILLPGLSTDADSYPVFAPNGEVYFAVSIFVDYTLSTEYAKNNYNRFLGVALVNILNGTIELFEPSNYELSHDDFLVGTYLDFYNWNVAPSWLQEQLKYPEDLWETQLNTDYVYHVDDAQTWLSGEDYFTLPQGQDVHYVTMNIKGQTRYMGVQLVQFAQGQGANLAGIYLVGSGNYEFGKTKFYRAGGGGQVLFGPVSALEALKADPDVKSILTLLQPYDTGNILLYQINGTLLYVIPVYVDVGAGSGATITKLGGVGLVDALTGEQVSFGSNVIEAYETLYGNFSQSTYSNTNLTLGDPMFTDTTITPTTNTTLPIIILNNDQKFHNATIRIITYSPNIDVYRYGTQLTPTVYSSNRTFTIDSILLGPDDFYGTTLTVSASLDQGAILEQYRVTLQVLSNGTIVENIELSLIVQES